MIKVAVLGYGTIGSGVVEILENNKSFIRKQIGDEVQVKYVLDLREFPGSSIESILVHDFNIILQDPEISIVIEVMGGVHPAYDFVKAALLAGKSAVTSNKALVAACGTELLRLAEERHLNFQFESSVGGGIPIIRPMYASLTAGETNEITGILNGTTNFMLTKMFTEGRTYEDVLAEAQALGYAERDPSADVDGFDTCRKIAILASIAFGSFVDYREIDTRGIREITDTDMAFADAMGYAIKLFGSCKRVGADIFAQVSPVLVGKSHPLYSVNDVFNGILVKGDMTGDLMFYGSGAGKLPTASAVVADIVEIAKNFGRTIMPRWNEEKLKLSDISGAVSRFFVRVTVNTLDSSASLQEAKETVKNLNFGAEAMVDLEERSSFAFLSREMSQAEVKMLCKQLPEALETTDAGAVQYIPVV